MEQTLKFMYCFQEKNGKYLWQYDSTLNVVQGSNCYLELIVENILKTQNLGFKLTSKQMRLGYNA